ncbi:MAG: hypothetical protein R2751_09395 [Bacteroidales bacterium]
MTPYFDGGCAGTPVEFEITVNPTAHVNDPLTRAVQRSATAAVTFTTNNTGGAVTYDWNNDDTSIGLGARWIGNIPSFTATNVGTAPRYGDNRCDPLLRWRLCRGATESFTITVNPTAQVNDPGDQELCNGQPLRW